MSNTISDVEQARVKKGGELRGKVISLSTILLVIAITVALFLFSDTVAEFKELGYLGAFLISLVANATIILPMPGLLLLVALGTIFNSILVGLLGAVGGAIGELTGYIMGRSGRRLVGGEKIYYRAESWMRKRGFLTIFLFSLLPFLPLDLAGMLAGVLRYSLWKFLLACFLGKAVLYVIIIQTGAWWWEIVTKGVNPATTVVLAAVATGVVLITVLAVEDWEWKSRK